MNNQKAIFITGGGSGIGRAMAQYFAARGWFIGLGDIDSAAMEGTAALLPDNVCFTHTFDVRDRAAWDIALDAFSQAAGGRMDVLANNAGIAVGGVLTGNSTDEITRCLDINLKGVFFGAQAAYPHLKRTAPDSCLLNTASAAGLYGIPSSSVYSAAKAGVRSLTESLDGEWAEDNIKVRSLSPAFIDTPMLDQTIGTQSNESIRQQVTASNLEITPPEEVAKTAWKAIHGNKLHLVVGKSARKLNFASRWLPGQLRKQARISSAPLGTPNPLG